MGNLGWYGMKMLRERRTWQEVWRKTTQEHFFKIYKNKKKEQQ
jgi:hypothetical protein